MLELKNVSYQTDQRKILKNINLTIEKGSSIAIVGPSGSGKSTLLRAISNLISVTSGEIYFKGKTYAQYQPEKLRQHVSYLPQAPSLFGETIKDNLIFPSIIRKESFNEDRAYGLLQKVGLGRYDLCDKVANLSGGEKQRITIARQLMYTPDVLLLDESTSALDEQNQINIEKHIFELNQKGVALLWITHDTSQSHRQFEKRITIDAGEITHEEVLK
ncbi:ATP-binding cassette domain-containing protein [Staphylococcus massiliensis]|uniref:ABC transporter ATP-binding protein n=1 Tax=Staphylococcus massiliensis TaxID=555791 RepID=UPI001EDFDA19|nr:ATP-binding cassette domain-containing protein [Staphylococcus massiliensis]MCG3413541.1 ATP-binding cassette domain-containing protein [Staphylococcus massiliensis]